MGDIFYNKTVTVYNKTSDDLMGSETWYATVLKNVRLIVTKVCQDWLMAVLQPVLHWQKSEKPEEKQSYHWRTIPAGWMNWQESWLPECQHITHRQHL